MSNAVQSAFIVAATDVVPSTFRWTLRVLSYASLMVVVGVVVTEALVWRAMERIGNLRVVTETATALLGVLALVQLLYVASDLTGRSPRASFGSLGDAVQTQTGLALAVRAILALAVWLVLVRARPATAGVLSDVTLLLCVGLLGTWSFAGHASWMRWPGLGVALDVAHHGAAAAWLGGLAVIGLVGTAHIRSDELGQVIRRFTRMAESAIVVLVVTGVAQAVRIVDAPTALLDTAHGRLLIGKVVVAIGLVVVSRVHRGRVERASPAVAPLGAGASGSRGPSPVAAARGMVRVQLAVGLVVIALTASLAVSLPAAAQ